jgi:hypothetical protein
LKPGSASRSSCLSYLPTMPLVPWSTKPVGTCFLTVPRGANSRPFIITFSKPMDSHGRSRTSSSVSKIRATCLTTSRHRTTAIFPHSSLVLHDT